MPITDHEGLDALCASCGIVLDYYDIRGQRHEPNVEVKRSLLAALRLPVDSDDDIRCRLRQVESRKWQTVVAPAVVRRQNDLPMRLMLTLDSSQIDSAITWQLNEEAGQHRHGEWQINPADAIDESVVDGTRLMRFEVTLPGLTDTGYHHLVIKAGDDAGAQTTLIVAPETCYQPPELADGTKIWGISLQLFSLRSERNWGIGDFTDLQSVVEIFAPLGINVLGFNPLHALFPHLPQNASPYSPSSRDFLNPVYLDVEAIDEFIHDSEVKRLVMNPEFQARLQDLRGLELIDYEEVWNI